MSEKRNGGDNFNWLIDCSKFKRRAAYRKLCREKKLLLIYHVRYIFKWYIISVSLLLFPLFIDIFQRKFCTFSYYFSVISTQLELLHIGTLHQNAFPSRTKRFETLPFGKQRKRLSRQKFRISFFFSLFHHPFSSPTMMLKNERRIENNKNREKRERGEKKKSKRRLEVESELMRLGVVRPR